MDQPGVGQQRRDAEQKRSNDDWIEYRRMIVGQITDIARDIETINSKIERIRVEDLTQIKLDIALLKFQAAMWGAIAGTVLSVITAVVIKVFLK